jgi:hypothetical protein
MSLAGNGDHEGGEEREDEGSFHDTCARSIGVPQAVAAVAAAALQLERKRSDRIAIPLPEVGGRALPRRGSDRKRHATATNATAEMRANHPSQWLLAASGDADLDQARCRRGFYQ